MRLVVALDFVLDLIVAAVAKKNLVRRKTPSSFSDDAVMGFALSSNAVDFLCRAQG